MNCRESRPLLPLFLDGELESRQMRAVALHSTRCSQCEDELRGMERLQDAIAAQISAEIEQIDLSRVWSAVAPRLGSVSPTWQQRWEEWSDSIREGWRNWAPVSAAVAAAGVLAILLWQGNGSTTPKGDGDSSVIVESVRSSVGSLALVSEPKTDTMLMWITDDGAVTVDDLGDLR
jgi:hypothetical protein